MTVYINSVYVSSCVCAYVCVRACVRQRGSFTLCVSTIGVEDITRVKKYFVNLLETSIRSEKSGKSVTKNTRALCG